jgi:hypothetical protein
MDETERAEQMLDALDPGTAEMDNTEDLRAVAVAADAVAGDQARLAGVVGVARAHGRSWTRIGTALGISRQAARQRFADKTSDASPHGELRVARRLSSGIPRHITLIDTGPIIRVFVRVLGGHRMLQST